MKHYYVRMARRNHKNFWIVVCVDNWREVRQEFPTEADAKMWILLHGIEIDIVAWLNKTTEIR